MSSGRIAVVAVVALAAFGVAFATAKAGSDGDGGEMPGAERIEAPSGSPAVPTFAPPAAVPALKAPPAPAPSGEPPGDSSGGAAPTPAPPAPPAPSPAPPSGGGPIIEG